MQFEPRIISDDGDDRDLPDDLLILAEQLTADADRLAAVYPVDRRDRSPAVVAASARLSPKSNWRRIVGAAAILAAVGIGGWTALGPRNVEHPRGNIAVSSHVAESAPVMSSSLFQDLTGPEKEAVLDLLEGDGARPASLSI